MPNYEKKPYLKAYRYKSESDKPLNKQVCVRVTEEMYEAIKKVPNHPELIRVLLQEWLEGFKNEDISE